MLMWRHRRWPSWHRRPLTTSKTMRTGGPSWLETTTCRLSLRRAGTPR
ncbi:hypothetical protein LINGRAPRIM_LOCUS1431 [Linum grandiflorum]